MRQSDSGVKIPVHRKLFIVLWSSGVQHSWAAWEIKYFGFPAGKEPNSLSLLCHRLFLAFPSLMNPLLLLCKHLGAFFFFFFFILQNQNGAIKPPGEAEHQFPPIDFGIKGLLVSSFLGGVDLLPRRNGMPMTQPWFLSKNPQLDNSSELRLPGFN